MPCEYCERDGEASYEVEATVGGTDATVEFQFCSRECVSAWAAPDPDYSGVTVSGDPVDEGVQAGDGAWTGGQRHTGVAQD